MKIKITTDSVADLNNEIYEKYDIGVLPLYVRLGDNEYKDGVNITTNDIYSYVAETNKLPKTAAISALEYQEKFEEYLQSGYDAIVHISLSNEMSVTHNNAKTASEQIKNVYVVNSKSLSTGVGLLVLYACELRDAGLSAQEIVNKLEERVPFVQASFILDKLNYLHKGGRCSSVALLGANLLKIKPNIEVKDGKMGVSKKYIGKFDKSLPNYINDTLAKFNNYDTKRVFVTHTKIDQKYVDMAKEILRNNTNFEEIIETTAGSTITSHCGENTIGILYFNNKVD